MWRYANGPCSIVMIKFRNLYMRNFKHLESTSPSNGCRCPAHSLNCFLPGFRNFGDGWVLLLQRGTSFVPSCFRKHNNLRVHVVCFAQVSQQRGCVCEGGEEHTWRSARCIPFLSQQTQAILGRPMRLHIDSSRILQLIPHRGRSVLESTMVAPDQMAGFLRRRLRKFSKFVSTCQTILTNYWFLPPHPGSLHWLGDFSAPWHLGGPR